MMGKISFKTIIKMAFFNCDSKSQTICAQQTLPVEMHLCVFLVYK